MQDRCGGGGGGDEEQSKAGLDDEERSDSQHQVIRRARTSWAPDPVKVKPQSCWPSNRGMKIRNRVLMRSSFALQIVTSALLRQRRGRGQRWKS